MAGHDEVIHQTCATLRQGDQRLGRADGIHVRDAGVQELPKAVTRHRLWNPVMMPERVKRFRDHEIGHNNCLAGDDRAFDPAAGHRHL